MKLHLLFAAAALSAIANAAVYTPKAGETDVKLSIKGKGDIVIMMYTKEAPKTVANFLKLVKSGFYNGIKFHRVVPDFVVQAGDPQSKKLDINDKLLGQQGSDETVVFENNNLTHKVGTVAMALTSPHSATGTSQFFINLKQNDFLNGNYCVFGNVVSGMDVVTKLIKGDVISKASILTITKTPPVKKKPVVKKAVKK